MAQAPNLDFYRIMSDKLSAAVAANQLSMTPAINLSAMQRAPSESPSLGGSSVGGGKRAANKICRVCGDSAIGYNFDVVSCESCKAFFRRNALRPKALRCAFENNCEVTKATRRFCQKCRLKKCFDVGMCKDNILSEEALAAKRQQQAAKKRTVSTHSSDNQSPDRPPAQVSRLNFRSLSSGVNGHLMHSPTTSSSSPPHPTDPQPHSATVMSTPTASLPGFMKLEPDLKPTSIHMAQQTTPAMQRVPASTIYQPSTGEEVNGAYAPVNNSQRQSSPKTQYQCCTCSCICGAYPAGTKLKTIVEISVDQKMKDTQRKSSGSSTQFINFNALSSNTYGGISFTPARVQSENAISDTDWTERDEQAFKRLEECCGVIMSSFTPDERKIDQNLADERRQFDTEKSHNRTKRDPLPTHFVCMIDSAVRRIIEASKNLPEFASLMQEDQIALLKGSIMEMMILRYSMNYDVTQETWRQYNDVDCWYVPLESIKVFGEKTYNLYKRFQSTFDPTWRHDKRLIMLLMLITLFKPDRPRLHEHDTIQGQYFVYKGLLKRYIRQLYVRVDLSAYNYAVIMSKLDELNNLNEVATAFFEAADTDSIGPLLTEMFDLHP